jgi:aspartate aminotransferase-like enzyme
VQISETSTGVQHPVQALGRLTRALSRDRNIFLVADGVSSLGISPVDMDEWGIDCLVAGSQKGLMTPPGLALIALSEKARTHADDIASNCLYFDLRAARASLEDKGETVFTPPVSLLYGLRESLRLIDEGGGPDALFRKQWALTVMVRTGVRLLGLELFAPSDFAWGVTSVALPAGVDAGALLRLMHDEWGVIAEGGQDHLRGRIIRIGHMGWVDWADITGALHALAWALPRAGGYTACRGYLEGALAAYAKGLEVEPGHAIDNA